MNNKQQHNAAEALAKIEFGDIDIISAKPFGRWNLSGGRRDEQSVRLPMAGRANSAVLGASELLELYTALTGEQVGDPEEATKWRSDAARQQQESVQNYRELERLRAEVQHLKKVIDDRERLRELIVEGRRVDNEESVCQIGIAYEKGLNDAGRQPMTRKQKSEITRGYLAECREECLTQLRDFELSEDGATARRSRVHVINALLCGPKPE